MIKFLNAFEMEALYGNDMEQNEAYYQLILGNIITTKKKAALNEDIDILFGVIEEDGLARYYFCNYLPYDFCVCSVLSNPPGNVEMLAKELVDAIKEKEIELAGLNGNKEFMEAFMKYYDELEFKPNIAMDIMVCKDVKVVDNVGINRRATLDDFEEIALMYQNFIKDALHEELAMEAIYTRLNTTFNNPKAYIWVYEVEGKIVGMNMSTRQLKYGATINGVYVKDEERGKGYCKQMMSASTSYYLNNGYDYVTLYVDKANPYSNGAYLAVGYEYVGSSYNYSKAG